MRITTSLSTALVLTAAANAGDIDLGLQDVLENTPKGEIVSTLVYMQVQADIEELEQKIFNNQVMTKHDRAPMVINMLMDAAEQTQAPLQRRLEQLSAKGLVEDHQAYWIVNAFRVDATAAVIQELAARDDVYMVYYNMPIEMIEPVGDPQPGNDPSWFGVENGVNAVNAPQAWGIGIDGTGTLVSSLDTGVDGNHPALANWRGNDPAYSGNPGWALYDPVTNWTFPQDSGYHGTHTMGTICGTSGVGVAPGAEWIHAAVIDRVNIPQTVADSITAFQWSINPDGDPSTSFDVPDVSSNSWGLLSSFGYPLCDSTFWVFLDALEAAGVTVVFAAGNEGTSEMRSPASRATNEYTTFAVAALDGNDPSYPIAGFSAQGPTFCTTDGSSAIKPEVAAPGVNVNSCWPGGSYSTLSGTSMACPHVAGVVSLMRQANPTLMPDQIKDIIYNTATDLGSPGNDNVFGHGIVDAYDAVIQALATAGLSLTLITEVPDFVDPTGGSIFKIQVSDQNAVPVPPTARLHVYNGINTWDIPMDFNGVDEYKVALPAMACPSTAMFFFSIEDTDGNLYTLPYDAPNEMYSVDVYSGIDVGFEDDFEIACNWTVTNSADLTSGAFECGIPAGDGSRGDPTAAASGEYCFLTENIAGNSDVDTGSTTLTSGVMDGSAPGAVLSYHRWFSNDQGDAPNTDAMVVEISGDGGTSWNSLETVGPTGEGVSGGWYFVEWAIDDIGGINDPSQIAIRFTVGDSDPQSIVEAAIDMVMISSIICDDVEPNPDLNGDGVVDGEDLALLLAAWGDLDSFADLNGDGIVDGGDLGALLGAWTL